MDPPNQLEPPSDPTPVPAPVPVRRRSSVAYDPARDTFMQIPDTVTEAAVEDDLPTQTNSPVQARPQSMSTTPTSRKRSRSPGESASLHSGNLASPEKRPRSRGPEFSLNGMSTPAENEREPRTNGRIPRIPRSDRDDRQPASRPVRGPSADVNQRQDQHREPRQRPTDERPRDMARVRERPRRRSRSPQRRVPAAYRRRSPPQSTRRDPDPISRSPSPIRDSPPRNLPRPGGGRGRGRNLLAEQERIQAQLGGGYGAPVTHGVQGVVNQWYNAVPEYVKEKGRDWRRNESQIKGLRSFNNWVKSCLIQKFSPQEKVVQQEEDLGWGEAPKEAEEIKPLLVLDIGCGKGGDLGKWDKAPQPVGLYCGLDPADQSIVQARDRYRTMWKGRRPRFDAEFIPKDCFGEWLGDVPLIQQIGIDPTPNSMNRWGKGGGFDIITMMFTMHYSFESQEKVEMMLRNVSGALKKGGRLIGVCPNSDVLSEKVKEWFKKNGDKYKATAASMNGATPSHDGAAATAAAANNLDEVAPAWKNSIYSVRFPPPSPAVPPLAPDGSFRPPTGHKYTYFIAEAVDVPEFVVPWEAFRAIAENYGLEQRYRKGFLDIWHHETDPQRATNTGIGTTSANSGGWGQEPVDEAADSTAKVAKELEQLGVRMGVVKYPGGPLQMTEDEKEAVAFYHAFCFVKT